MKSRTARNTALALAGLAALAGCGVAVFPYYKDEDVVFDPGLLGEWQAADPNNSHDAATLRFEKSGQNAYHLVATDDDGKLSQLDAHLFKIQDQLFLDLTPSDYDFATNQGAIAIAALVPGHLLVRVDQIGPPLLLARYDFDWLRDYLKAHPAALAHQERTEDLCVLTATTSELQAFVRAHLQALFEQPRTFVPKAGSNPPPAVAAAPPAAALASPPSNAPVWVQWRSDQGGNNHYFALTPWPTNWAAAQALAHSWAGRLATITSASEQQFINRAFLIGRFEHAPVWIGLVRARTNATALTRVARALEDLGLPHSADPPPFKWVSKEPLAYSNWKPGEPNNFSGDENYVAINWQYSKDPPQGIQGDWNDAPLNGTTGFGGATDGPYFGLVERLTDPSQPPGIGTWPGPYRLLLIPAVLLAGGWAWRRLALKAKNGKSTPVKTAGGVD